MQKEKEVKATDLRLGNIIMRKGFIHEDKTFHQITVGCNDIMACGIDNTSFKYIPLTEEWLLKLGFSKEDYKKGYIGIDNAPIDFTLAEPNNKDHAGDHYAFLFNYGGWPLSNSFKYVHELQNFFFALNEKELTIK